MAHLHVDHADVLKSIRAFCRPPRCVSNEWLDWIIDLAVRVRACDECSQKVKAVAVIELPPRFRHLHPAQETASCLDIDGLERASRNRKSKEAVHQRSCLRCTFRLYEAVAVSMRAEDRKKGA